MLSYDIVHALYVCNNWNYEGQETVSTLTMNV